MRLITKLAYIVVGLLMTAYIGLSAYVIYAPWPLPAWLTPYFSQDNIRLALLITGAAALLAALLLVLKGLLAPRKQKRLVRYQDGGSITMSKRAMKNIVYLTTENITGVVEDNVGLRLVKKGSQTAYRVKIRLGIVPTSTAVAQADAICQAVAQNLEHATGVPCERVDIIFKETRLEKNKGGE